MYTPLELAHSIAKYIRPAKSFLVGGCVRDEILGLPIVDVDMEVYGVSMDELEEKVAAYVKTENIEGAFLDVVGKSFGVLKLRFENAQLDISLPRRDSKVSVGHKGFNVQTDPNLEPKDAARRRDFTMNAMMKDLETGELFDFFGGQEDLRTKTLRAVDPLTFAEDPLRVLRGLQFAARFEILPDFETRTLFTSMKPELESLAPERIRDEWTKLLLKAENPSIGLALGMELGIWDVWYPLFRRMLETPQEPDWHPEGNVWDHTLLAVDHAAQIIRGNGPSYIPVPADDRSKFVVMMATFCHDFGKPDTTTKDDGRIRSRGHDSAGVPLTRAFLEHLKTIDHTDIDTIEALVAEHIWPALQYRTITSGRTVTDGALRRLAARLHPATIEQLAAVNCADHLGRGPFPHGSEWNDLDAHGWPNECPSAQWILQEADRLKIMNSAPKPLIPAHELLKQYPKLKPGPEIGNLMRTIERMHNEDGKTKTEILEILDQRFS